MVSRLWTWRQDDYFCWHEFVCLFYGTTTVIPSWFFWYCTIGGLLYCSDYRFLAELIFNLTSPFFALQQKCQWVLPPMAFFVLFCFLILVMCRLVLYPPAVQGSTWWKRTKPKPKTNNNKKQQQKPPNH